MNPVPEMASVSELRNNYSNLFDRIEAGPLVIANRNQPVAVMVSPAQWNALAEEMDDLHDVIAALQAELAIATGRETPQPLDLDELRKATDKDAVPA
ncbi:MAG: type II toxin-antitoxin system Phd/YefM family antitoxin [Caldilineaceae bacterium]|nr:type II toxin-antitoxin system Phd/YefM family antitoxin [Caldilineaceae bacterium]MCB9158303.1 type II toxin-antitoxin system Phd/YefM family antitoxin [Caldilineaceae bacterium]